MIPWRAFPHRFDTGTLLWVSVSFCCGVHRLSSLLPYSVTDFIVAYKKSSTQF
jgi:hypothetical protein